MEPRHGVPSSALLMLILLAGLAPVQSALAAGVGGVPTDTAGVEAEVPKQKPPSTHLGHVGGIQVPPWAAAQSSVEFALWPPPASAVFSSRPLGSEQQQGVLGGAIADSAVSAVSAMVSDSGTITFQQSWEGYDGCTGTTIYMMTPDKNYWWWNSLLQGYRQQFASLLRFDITAVPVDTVVTRATLHLYASGWSGEQSTIGVYAVTRAVNPREATWNEAEAGSPWTQPGCNDTVSDRRASPERTSLVDTIGEWYEWDVTALVQDWHSRHLPNQGVLLRSESSTSQSTVYFAGPEHPNVEWRPRLVVTYDVPPEPWLWAWTVMVYLDGDNELDVPTAELFNRLELAKHLGCEAKILVLWDRRGPGNTVLYLVQPDGNEDQLAAYVEDQTMWHRGELNMGDPATLSGFIRETRSRHPGDAYLLAIVDHGGGWAPDGIWPYIDDRYAYGGSMFCRDITPLSDYLSTMEMGQVFSAPEMIAHPLNVVLYDACLMGMVEEAYEIRRGARYLVASESQVFTSYPYDRYLVGIRRRSPEQLVRWIVDTFSLSLPGYATTMAAIDLQAVDRIGSSLDTLARELDRLLPGAEPLVRQAYAEAQKLDCDHDRVISQDEAIVDLGSLAGRLALGLSGVDQSAWNAADGLMHTLRSGESPVVVYERHSSGMMGHQGGHTRLDGATGLGIFCPLGEYDFDWPHYALERQLALVRDTYWEELLTRLIGEPSWSELVSDALALNPKEPSRPLDAFVSAIFLPILLR